MSTPHDSEGFVSTPLEGQGAHRKDNYYPRTARRTKFASARLMMSTNDSNRILLEIDEQDITLGAICLRVLHHAEDSFRDVQRTYLSSR